MTEKHHKKSKDSSEEIQVKIEPAGKNSGRPESTNGTASAGVETKELIPVEKLQAQLEEKTREATENFDKWLRSVAECENFKKRAQKEKADMLKFANEGLLRALLPVLDNLERALDHARKEQEKSPLMEGVEMTWKQFLSVLEKFGVRPISAVGEVFDPEKHEAVFQKESEGEPNRVISELEKGYFYHDRLLRPAKVVVSKATPKKEG